MAGPLCVKGLHTCPGLSVAHLTFRASSKGRASLFPLSRSLLPVPHVRVSSRDPCVWRVGVGSSSGKQTMIPTSPTKARGWREGLHRAGLPPSHTRLHTEQSDVAVQQGRRLWAAHSRPAVLAQGREEEQPLAWAFPFEGLEALRQHPQVTRTRSLAPWL